MRHTLVKLAGLMLAVMLVLTGCNLIGVDPIMQLDEDFAALEKDYAAVVAEYDGGTVTKGDVLGSFASEYSYYSQLYSMFGMSMTSDVVESIKQETVEYAMQGVAVAKEFDARGLSLSDEKRAEVESAADENYQQAYDAFYETAEGKEEAVRARQTEYDLYANGYTKDIFYKSQLQQAQYELIQETVEGEIEALTDEELNAAYEEKVAADEEQYADNYGGFESAMTSDEDIVAWIPEGYRTVKHILIIPESDVLTAVTDARAALSDAESDLEGFESELDALNDDDAEADEADDSTLELPRAAEEIQADIDSARGAVETARADAEAAEAACLASVQDKLDELYARIEAGEDFDALIDEYGEDPGMQNEPTATRGYYVNANSANWDGNFTNGAMALANVGDVSEPVIGASGVHIIRYESDAPAGAVALDEIRDALYDEALEEAKTQHFSDELASWIDALNPVYHLDAFDVA